MRKVSLSITAFFITLLSFANEGDGEYAVSKIPDSLLKNANAVLRLEETRYDVKSTKNYVVYYHYVITVLNENGDRWGGFTEWYDKLQTIKNVEGGLFDADGNQLKKMKWKDLQDLSGTDDISLADDNRIKAHNFYCKTYPYTIEYFEEVEHTTTFHFPMWIPQGGEKLSVQKSVMEFMCPGDYKFRYKAFNYKEAPVLSNIKDKAVYTWSISNLPAIVKEPLQPMLHEITPAVIFGANEFEMGNYKGNMGTWKEYGKFQNLLNEGRDILPSSVKQIVHQLTDTISNVGAKIKVLYDMLQKNTRYISIQLGIGGWQPFDATYVAAKGYGDCKALSNYMKALLKEAGIKSCYTIIRAGRNEKYITSDFPSTQFNHIILCVPLQKDTMWLECTSQTLPAGYLSDFTSDRYALAIDENGGFLVRTPKYGIKENLQLRHIAATLDGEASLQIKSKASYGGLQQDQYHSLINGMSKDKVKEALHEELDFGTYEVNNFSYTENKSSLPFIEEQLEITVSRYAAITGKRLFIIPNIMTRHSRKLNADTARKFDLDLTFEYNDVDTVEINLPEGYTPESVPQDVAITSKFGKYNCAVKITGNKLFYYRNMEQYSGRFPASSYNELVQFYEKIYKADRNKVVMVKSEATKGF